VKSPSSITRGIARSAAKEVSQVLKKVLRSRDYCVGFHIRHALETASPVHEVCSTDNDFVQRVNTQMRLRNVNPLNHVIDAISYRGHGLCPDMRRIEICFADSGSNGSAFHMASRGSLVIDGTLVDALQFEGVWRPTWSLLNCRTDVEVSNFLYTTYAMDAGLGWSSPFEGYLGGVQKLCESLSLTKPTIVHYRSLVASVLQLGEFTPQFGKRTVTFLLRNGGPFGASVGTTLVFNEPAACLEATQIDQLVIPILRDISRDTQTLMENRTKRCAARRSGLHGATRLLLKGTPGRIREPIAQRLASFLEFTERHFSNVTAEGVSQSFGIVLGQVKMIRYWPGGHDFYLEPAACAAVQASAHLMTPLGERLLVFSLAAECVNGSWFDHQTAILDLGQIPEEIQGDDDNSIWDPAYRPIAYITRCYPWALGIVAGPDRQMRVFSRGELVLHGSGAKWRRFAPVPHVRQGAGKAPWHNAPAWYRPHLSLIVRFSLQFSKVARRDAHGSLLLWIPEEDPGLEKLLHSKTRPLRDNEPKEQSGRPWLTGRELILGGDCKTPRLNPYVARQLVRAGMNDGAIILVGRNARVWGFRRHLEFWAARVKYKELGGAKRSAAVHAVEYLKEYCGVVAICVSSDGDVLVARVGSFHSAFKDLPP
jgi:hypothetical protein